MEYRDDTLSSDRYVVQLASTEGDAPLCPDCRTPLLFSEEQAPCIYTLLDPAHGEQAWWDCPNCEAVWETAECNPETDWLCQSWEGVAS